MPTTRLRIEDWLLWLQCSHHSTSTHWILTTVTYIVVMSILRLIEDWILWRRCRLIRILLLALNGGLYNPLPILPGRHRYAFSTSYTISSYLPYYLTSLTSTNRRKTSTYRESPSPSPLQSDPPSLCATFTKRKYDLWGSEPSYKIRTYTQGQELAKR